MGTTLLLPLASAGGTRMEPLLLSGTRPLRLLSNSSCSAVRRTEGRVSPTPFNHKAVAVLLQAVGRRQSREAASIGEVLVGHLIHGGRLRCKRIKRSPSKSLQLGAQEI